MDDLQKLEDRRLQIIATWKQLGDVARASGSKELEEHARKHQAALEEPPTKAGLGDWIANLTKAVGIPPCDQCKKRQAALNSLDTSKPVNELVRDVFRAILTPS